MTAHPFKTIVSREAARLWHSSELHVTRKMDGNFSERLVSVHDSRFNLIVEHMKPKSGGLFTPLDKMLFARHGEFFAAITIAEIDGVSVLGETTRSRWDELCRWMPSIQSQHPNIVRVETNTDIDTVIESGGEGMCAVPWDSSYGFMLTHKAESIYLCTVTAIGGTQAATIRVIDSGATCKVKLGGGKIDQCRVGSIIRVGGMGLTDKGAIRQPVACRDWLVTL